MATIPPVVDNSDPRCTTVTWTNITTADVGGKVDVSYLEDIKTIQIVGAGTAQIRRSNDGTNFVNFGSALATATVTDLAATAAKWLDVNPVTVNTATVVLVGKRKRS